MYDGIRAYLQWEGVSLDPKSAEAMQRANAASNAQEVCEVC